jgi:magnesium chelatase family protein
LGSGDGAFIEELARKHRLSGRGIMRGLAVARTIADIEQQERVSRDHLFEAVNYRAKDGVMQ